MGGAETPHTDSSPNPVPKSEISPGRSRAVSLLIKEGKKKGEAALGRDWGNLPATLCCLMCSSPSRSTFPASHPDPLYASSAGKWQLHLCSFPKLHIFKAPFHFPPAGALVSLKTNAGNGSAMAMRAASAGAGAFPSPALKSLPSLVFVELVLTSTNAHSI